jgi:hypothetical protein
VKQTSKGDTEIENGVIEIINKPVTKFDFYNYYYVMWYKALKNAVGENTVNILEIASGDEDIVPQVMDKLFGKESQYVSFDMNKKLMQELNRKTNGLAISVLVMEEDAKLITDYFGPGYFNMVVFQHSIKNVVQAILCRKEGIDIKDSDWMEVPPDVAKIILGELQEGSLEQHVKKEFLNLISDCMDTLTQNGMMIFSHHMFQLDLDWRYHSELYNDMFLIIRKCILESDLKLEEIEFEGFDKQWWMFLRKK